MNLMRAPSRNPLAGFSLVEMAIVLTIVGLLMATLLPSLTAQIEQQRRNDTRKQLAEIQQALMGFAIMNGRLPCPTIEPNPAAAGYGVEASSCQSDVTQDGYLPWKTLGVSEIDAWGTKRTSTSSQWYGYWRYRVDRKFSDVTNPITMNTGFCSGTNDCLLVKDSNGNNLTETSSTKEHPVAIIFSTGPNLTGDGQNASYQATNAIYQSDVPSANFDDILIWLSRPQLFNRMVAAGKLP